jgi:hypothetical protein
MNLKFVQIAIALAPNSRLVNRDEPDLYGLTAEGTVYRYAPPQKRWVPLPMTATPEPESF